MLIPRQEVKELPNPGKFIPAQILNSLGSLFKKCEEEVRMRDEASSAFDIGAIGEKFTNSVVRRGIQ
jgi:hypothetical protein